ncbi:Uncharacterized protein conserved in cyanobacteria [Gloeomargarita lithophora Alchichica-D10]|uniref:Uncharacterized protein conserved in cyanobacteria n=1 Tax=Gloeomargarita lithophora Alchichica-D10 TaxID=1188229 RepID=A0A1J0AEP0_9CYAN|nr:Uma2 family endonuclease [Gloeomargarita lithophora]APB34401.1 Uncharacterized protein conserved in cyanobacteria [Gloeomargarita lithophora Alchichica-D10]
MTQTSTLSLAEFLTQSDIESSPAWEWLLSRPIQKPMPTLFHSRLQRHLVNWINAQTRSWEAVQELRCIVPPDSPVPDIVVVPCHRLGATDGPLQGAPDWLIEIRSPGQNTLDLQAKILHCLRHETQLAWLIDWERQQVWVWAGGDLPHIYTAADALPTLGDLPTITVAEVMQMTAQGKIP